jgi:hypothetical protein
MRILYSLSRSFLLMSSYALFDFYRELNIDGANQSLRIIKNLIDAGSCQSYAAIDICMLLEFTKIIIRTKLSDAYGLVMKVLSKSQTFFLGGGGVRL